MSQKSLIEANNPAPYAEDDLLQNPFTQDPGVDYLNSGLKEKAVDTPDGAEFTLSSDYALKGRKTRRHRNTISDPIDPAKEDA